MKLPRQLLRLKKVTFQQIFVFVLLFALAVTGACSATTSGYADDWEADYYVEEMEVMDSPTVVLMESSGSSGSSYKYDSVESEETTIRMIAQSGKIYIEVTEEEYDQVKDALHTYVAEYGGYLSQANEQLTEPRTGSAYRTYTITMEIPSQYVDDAFTGISGLGKVTSSQMSAKDMTDSYQNYEEKLASAKALKERMEELLDQAETFEDVLEIEERLIDLDSDIASYERTLAGIDADVDYADIYVRVTEQKDDPRSVFDNFLGINDLLENVVESFENLLEILSHLLVYILLVVGVVYVWVWRKKRKNTKEEKGRKKAGKK